MCEILRGMEKGLRQDPCFAELIYLNTWSKHMKSFISWKTEQSWVKGIVCPINSLRALVIKDSEKVGHRHVSPSSLSLPLFFLQVSPYLPTCVPWLGYTYDALVLEKFWTSFKEAQTSHSLRGLLCSHVSNKSSFWSSHSVLLTS